MRPDKNVIKFLRLASGEYGSIAGNRFEGDLLSRISEEEISSPIEQLFFIALCSQCFAERENFNPEPEPDNKGGWQMEFGVSIHPQAKIGRYRVDFLLNRIGYKCDKTVIVELDGHDFHEKNKEQRAYEKARDRFFVKNGYKVLHFTGSEVVKDPYKCAYEALEVIGGISNREEYSDEYPLGDNK